MSNQRNYGVSIYLVKWVFKKKPVFCELFITNFILSTLFTLLVLSYIYILFKKYFNIICFATWVNIASWCFIENPLIVFKETEQRLAQILLRAITIYRRKECHTKITWATIINFCSFISWKKTKERWAKSFANTMFNFFYTF